MSFLFWRLYFFESNALCERALLLKVKQRRGKRRVEAPPFYFVTNITKKEEARGPFLFCDPLTLPCQFPLDNLVFPARPLGFCSAPLGMEGVARATETTFKNLDAVLV